MTLGAQATGLVAAQFEAALTSVREDHQLFTDVKEQCSDDAVFLPQVITGLNAAADSLPPISQIASATDGEVLELARVSAFLVKRLLAVGTGCAGVLEQRLSSGAMDTAATAGFVGAAQLVRDLTGCSIGEARSRLRLAAATVPKSDASTMPGTDPEDVANSVADCSSSSPTFGLVAAALEKGVVSEAAATKIVDTLVQHESRGGTSANEMEAALIDAAQSTHLDEVRRACSQAAAVWDPRQVIEADYKTGKQRFLTIGSERHGVVSLRGGLAPEVAAQLEVMLNTITSPRTKRLPESFEQATPTPIAGHTGWREDPRNAGQKRHDAFAAILGVAAATATKTVAIIEEGALETPVVGGSGMTVMIQTSREALQERKPGLVHTNNGPVSISGPAIEHAACSGAIQFYATDTKGKIVALGNVQRVFTAHQKRVILARDGGCVIPGCDVSAQWCEVHHVTPHAQGGATHTRTMGSCCVPDTTATLNTTGGTSK